MQDACLLVLPDFFLASKGQMLSWTKKRNLISIPGTYKKQNYFFWFFAFYYILIKNVEVLTCFCTYLKKSLQF